MYEVRFEVTNRKTELAMDSGSFKVCGVARVRVKEVGKKPSTSVPEGGIDTLYRARSSSPFVIVVRQNYYDGESDSTGVYAIPSKDILLKIGEKVEVVK